MMPCYARSAAANSISSRGMVQVHLTRSVHVVAFSLGIMTRALVIVESITVNGESVGRLTSNPVRERCRRTTRPEPNKKGVLERGILHDRNPTGPAPTDGSVGPHSASGR